MVLTSLFIVDTCIKRITRKLNIHVTCYMQYTCNNDWTCTLQCTVLCMSNVYILRIGL